MSYDNPWLYNGQVVDSEVLENYLGFVYLITNLTNNKKYIGKKLLKRTKTNVVKGKKKRSLVESDWKDYYGSNRVLAEDVSTQGIYNFKREITRFCTKKGELSYYEAHAQFSENVLLRDDWYNGWINVKVQRSHLPK